MPAEQLAELLGVHGEAEREAFAGRLAAMERDGQLMTNRKGQLCVVAKLDLVTGTVQGHPDGFGFLVPDDGGADLFLSPKEMHKVLHGDRVIARDRRRRSARPARGRDRRRARARQSRSRRPRCTKSAASGSSSRRTSASARTS